MSRLNEIDNMLQRQIGYPETITKARQIISDLEHELRKTKTDLDVAWSERDEAHAWLSRINDCGKGWVEAQPDHEGKFNSHAVDAFQIIGSRLNDLRKRVDELKQEEADLIKL